jgi:hypothetical protein
MWRTSAFYLTDEGQRSSLTLRPNWRSWKECLEAVFANLDMPKHKRKASAD